jgi:hypothetical protein
MEKLRHDIGSFITTQLSLSALLFLLAATGDVHGSKGSTAERTLMEICSSQENELFSSVLPCSSFSAVFLCNLKKPCFF